MTDFFNFEPSDFQLIEEFEFDETVQREERVRFYTLQEQTVDAYEKFLPRGHVSRYKLNELKQEVDNLRDLYETYIVTKPEGYDVREPERVKRIPWVFPVYSLRDWKPYNWGEQWTPLFTQDRRMPNAYPRMVDALPHGILQGDGTVYDFDRATEFLDTNGRNPLRALPPFSVVRTQRHEDGSFNVITVPREGTDDKVSFIGYYLATRGLDIPNPLAGHPFFENAEPRFVEAPQPLADVFPQIDAILDHGVPVTPDPYRVAMPYLRIYDVRMQDIPWNIWKMKFPQAETIDVMPEIVELKFPVPEQLAPPEQLARDYRSPYYPGLAGRYWLMHQLDGGEYHIKQLLTEVVSAGGSVALGALPSLAALEYPDTTPTAPECVLAGKTFVQFQTQGTLRAKNGKYKCVPLDFVRQERSQLGFLGRKPWTDTTAQEIVRAYQDAMKTYMMPPRPAARLVPERVTPAAETSQQRRDTVAILEDVRRYPEDKLYDLNRLLRESTLTGQIYKDPAGQFVLCSHTLAVLAGDLNADRKAFHEKWTRAELGFRVCKFCGERIVAEDFVEQTEYTEDGFAVKRASALGETVAHSAQGAALVMSGLQAIRPLFKEDEPCDSMVYLLLTLLQVVPDADKLQPVLLAGRTLSKSLKGEEKEVVKRQGAVGLVTAALILQTHIPTLLPRRSFGSKPLKLSGYPRDRTTPEDYTILDSLMMVLRKTFEAHLGSMKDKPAIHGIRWLLTSPANFKKTSLAIMTPLLKYPGLAGMLERAKEHVATQPPVLDPVTLLPSLRPPETADVVRSFPDCSSFRAFWTGPHGPKIVQPPIQLRSGIQAAATMQVVEPAVSVRAPLAAPTAAEIDRMLRRKVPAAFKKFVKVGEDWHTNLLLVSRLSEMFKLDMDVRGADPAMGAATLRDYAEGMVYEALHRIADEATNRETFRKALDEDIGLFVLMSDPEDQRRTYNSIRAVERKAFTDRMRAMTDMEREITSELVSLGLSAPVVTPEDRKTFAAQIEAPEEEEVEAPDDEEVARQQDAMVGGPAEDTYEEENLMDDTGIIGEQPQQQDDPETSI